ncbi:hypothetical protein TWF281_010123 [Arthrobotrys megalospora]
MVNDKIDYSAVANAASYANDGRARARLSRIDSKHTTRPRVLKDGEDEELEDDSEEGTSTGSTKDPISASSTVATEDTPLEKTKKKVRFADEVIDTDARVTRSSAAKALASGDIKAVKKKKRATPV